MIILIEILLRTLAYFFSACHACHLSHEFEHVQSDCNLRGFTVRLQTGISPDVDVVTQSEVIRKADFDPILRFSPCVVR